MSIHQNYFETVLGSDTENVKGLKTKNPEGKGSRKKDISEEPSHHQTPRTGHVAQFAKTMTKMYYLASKHTPGN